jgi:hypothetical protein
MEMPRMWTDEVLDDLVYQRLSQERRTELIAGLCAETERRIRTAASREEAGRIASDACESLGDACASSLARRVLAERLASLISEVWKPTEMADAG